MMGRKVRDMGWDTWRGLRQTRAHTTSRPSGLQGVTACVRKIPTSTALGMIEIGSQDPVEFDDVLVD